MKQVHKFTTIIFGISILAAVIGLSLTALIYSRTMNELSAMTSTSREALVVFAENVENVNTMEPNMNVDSVSGVDNDVFNAQPSEV